MKEKILGEYLTYDDVLLRPSYSEVLPNETVTKTRFSKNIFLNTPIVSAAMDTVTEWEMAVAIAQEGGIGVIHKNMPLEEQVKQIRKVKRAESGMIDDPITLHYNDTVGKALDLMKEFKIGGIPIVDKKNILVGIITNRDLRFEYGINKPIKELMTSKNIVKLNHKASKEEAEELLKKHRIEKLPVVNNNNEIIGLITYKDILKAKTRPNACKDEKGRLRVAVAIGIKGDYIENALVLEKAGADALVLDSAHGHHRDIVNGLIELKKHTSKVDIIAGNIATKEAARTLSNAGADGIKVGIGPGSICTTRVVTGVGVPQLSAIMEVANELKNDNVPVIADGGIKYSGDIPKAISGGADCVMLGSMLAGLEESPGEMVIYRGRKFKNYRGMGSIDAMKQGSSDRYFQKNTQGSPKLVPEGIVGRVPYRGKLSEVIFQLIGGLKSSMGYCGCKTISDLKKSKFIKVSFATLKENHPHGITITKEAPNYSVNE